MRHARRSRPGVLIPLAIAACVAGGHPATALADATFGKVYASSNKRELTEWARRYQHGEGVPRDLDNAIRLYCKAARKGDTDAQYYLGYMYANGTGVRRDEELAPYALAQAAEAGAGSERGTPAPPFGANPVLNRHYQGADFERWSDVFERPGREVFDQRFRIVHALRPYQGMRIADIGAGTGLFTVLLARAVGPEGVVYAIDTSPEFIAGIEERAREYHVTNIVPLVNTQEDTRLEPASIDLAFLSDTYHHLEQPRAMLDSIHRALKPFGDLVIVDLHRRPGFSSPWVMGHVRVGMEQVIAEVETAGFRLVEAPDMLRDNFFLRFEKLSDEPDVEVGPIEPLEPGPQAEP